MYNEFIEKLNVKWNQMMQEALAGANSRSAALRARKLSMQLRADLKEFRNVSISNDETLKRKNKKTETTVDVTTPPADGAATA